LAHASYLVGCQKCGEAIVIDPSRDVSKYLQAAKVEGVKITAVTETHIHADFLSGARELAATADATLYLSAEGGPDWSYQYVDAYKHVPVHGREVNFRLATSALKSCIRLGIRQSTSPSS